MDYSPPGASVHWISQARILEWVAIPFSRRLSRLQDLTQSPAWQGDSSPSEPPGKPMKRYSVLLITKKMQTKTTMRYHLTLVRMVIIKKSTNNKCRRGCGGKGTLLHSWWECTLIQTLWKTIWRFLKKKKMTKTTIWPNSSTTGHKLWENYNWKRHKYLNVHCITIYK